MKKVILFFATGLLLLAASCKKDSSNNGSGTSRVTVKLTDAPGLFDALILNVKQVVIISSGGRATVDLNERPIDILRFRAGRDTVLAGVDVPAGRLQEIRLVLYDTGNRVVVDGVSHDLKTPSGQSSGVKLKVQDDLTAGIAYTLLLDFDAAKSIVVTGNGKYNLKPVIRAIPVAVSGAIKGVVQPASAYPRVYAINGTDTVGAIADNNGNFFLTGLQAGNYRVEVVPLSPYSGVIIDNVSVQNNTVKDLGTVNLAD